MTETYNIIMKKGLKVNLPALLESEFGFCTDTHELFIGSAGGNLAIPTDVAACILAITQGDIDHWDEAYGWGDHAGLYDDAGDAAAARAAHELAYAHPPKLDDCAAPDDNTDLDATDSAHGLCPKLSGSATEYLDGSGAFSTPAGGVGYALTIVCYNLTTLNDGATYYFGGLAGLVPSTSEGQGRIYIPKAGNIKRVIVHWFAATAGSDETVTCNLRVNAGGDNEVGVVANTDAIKCFDSGAVTIPVSAGNYVELNIACPTWATNPGNVKLGGVIYIE